MAAVLRVIPWYVLVLPGALVWTTWLQNGVSPEAGLRGMAVALAIGLVGLAAFWVVTRDVRRAGILVLAIEVLILSKVGFALVAEVGARGGIGPAVALAGLMAAAIALGVRIAWKARARMAIARFHAGANTVAGLLVVVLAVSFVASGQAQRTAAELTPRQAALSVATAETAARPDIYLLLLDGYPRGDVLEARFGYDNRPFLDELRARGFAVADRAHSGYLWTRLSLASLFNMAYLEQIPGYQPVLTGSVPPHPTVRLLLDGSTGVAEARAHGYEIVSLSSGYEQVALRAADRWVPGEQITEFEVTLLESTFLGDMMNVIDPDFASRSHRQRIVETLEELPHVARTRSDRPRFVFAHLAAPHQPAVFGPDGEPIAVPVTADFYGDSSIEREIPLERFVREFTGQLDYLNRLVITTIDEIHAASRTPPIIIVMSDHGSASATDWRATSWRTADPAAVLERTGILFAASTPGESAVFPPDIQPVHVLALLYNAYLGTQHELASPPHGGVHIPPINASVLRNGEQ